MIDRIKSPPVRILVIDDDEVLLDSITDYLEDLDYYIYRAANGRIGLEIFEKEKPDLVLTDLRMPEVDGLDVLKAIREASPDTPTIVISGTGRIRDSIQALRMGAWDYLLKPVEDMSLIHHAVTAALGKAELIKQNNRYQEKLEILVQERTRELQTAYNKLNQSEERFRKLFENSSEAIFIVKPETGEYMNANEAAERLTGYSRDEILSKRTQDLTPDGAADRILLAQCLENTHSFGEVDYKRPDGSVRTAILNAYTLEDDSLVAGIAHDITDRLKTERALKKSEVKYRKLFDESVDMIHLVDMQGRFIDVNQTELDRLGYSRDEFLGKTVEDIVHPDYWAKTKSSLKRLLSGKKLINYETVIRTKSGEGIFVLVNALPLLENGEQVGARAYLRDITERKAAKNKLAKEKDFSKLIIDTMPAFMVLIEQNGDVKMMNNAMLEGLGYTSEEVQGVNFIRHFIPEEFHEEVLGVFSSVFTSETPSVNVHPVQTKSGNSLMVEWYGQFFTNAEDDQNLVMGVGVNVTKRIKAEKALRESEIKYRSFVENADDGVLISQDNKIRFANQKMKQIMGYEDVDVLDKPLIDFVIPEDRPRIGRYYEARMKGEPTEKLYEMTGVRRDGSRVPLEINAGVIDFEGRPGVLEFIRDISTRIEASKALDQAKRLTDDILETANVMIVGLDNDGAIQVFNPAAEMITGYTKEDLEGKNWFDTIVPEDRYPATTGPETSASWKMRSGQSFLPSVKPSSTSMISASLLKPHQE